MKYRPLKNFFRLPALIAGLIIGVWIGSLPAYAGAPRNIILMIGDGLGLETVWAAGAFQFGPDYHKFGGREKLRFELLSGFCWATTYPLNLSSAPTSDPKPRVSYDPTWTRGGRPGQLDYPRFGPDLTFDGTPRGEYGSGGGRKVYATESASAATSLACGIKTYTAAVGMDNFGRPCKNIVEKFQEKGKKAGVVTTVQFSHATPAAFVAHNLDRKNYRAIAEEMVRVIQPDVIMGAGHPGFDGYGIPTSPQYKYISPDDFRLLAREENSVAGPYLLVEKREDFLKLTTEPPPGKIFGLVPNRKGLPPSPATGTPEGLEIPDLRDLTRGSLEVLSRGGEGFFLMIEGGAIDRGHHANDLNLAIGETLGFEAAVAAVIDWIENPENPAGGWEKNLLIVTADHETGYLSGIESKGRGIIPDHVYFSKDHTNRLVGVWYQGAGMEGLQKYLKNIHDFERGPIQIIDNTEIHQVMEDCLQAEPEAGQK